MNSQQQQDAVRASITETISEQDIARLYYALDNFDQDLIPILSRLERAAMAGAELAKAVEEMRPRKVFSAGGWPSEDDTHWNRLRRGALETYRSAIEEKNV